MSDHWQRPWAELITRHMRDVYGWITTPEEILRLPNHQIWGAYMDALAYYGMQRTRFSLEDVPDEWKDGNIVNIREYGKLTQYVWHNGSWQNVGEIYDEMYRFV